MFRIVSAFLILLAGLQISLAENDHGGRHVLKDRIIRALSVSVDNPSHMLVGQKSGKPGSAFVFQSIDAGRTWRFLNGNRSLAPDATDVQAVVAFSSKILLAGTWKHGLYISRDGGRQFFPVAEFPSSDIRDLQVADRVIYAATGRQGVFASDDQGKSWKAVGPGEVFFWSLTASKDQLVASSPEQGVLERRDQSWQNIFDQDIAYASASSATSNLRAVAGETGLHILVDGEWNKIIADEKFADVLILDRDLIVAASWNNGVALVTPDGKEQKRLLEGLAVVHLQIANGNLIAATWGDGLHIVPLARFLP